MTDIENTTPYFPPLPLQTPRGVYNYMSTPTIYGIIRALCAETRGPYLEVGSYRGMSLLAAGAEQTFVRCYGVDMFTGVGYRADNKDILLSQIAPYRNIDLLEGDYAEVLPDLQRKRRKFSVVFIDGPHEEGHTARQLELCAPMLKKGGYIVIDDYQMHSVKAEADTFFEARRGEFEEVFQRTTDKRNHRAWWNGILINKRMA